MKNLNLLLGLVFTLLNLTAFAGNLPQATDDSTKIDFKKTKVIIITNDSTETDTIVDTEPYRGEDEDFDNDHWSGIELGFNGLVNSSNNINLGDENSHLDLNYSRSINWSINPVEKDFRLRGEYIKLVTGLGFQFYNYEFDKNYRLLSSQDSLTPILDTVNQFDKNRLKASFINVPLLLAFNTKQRKDEGVRLAVGAIFGYKLSSRTKQVYQLDGDRTKDVVRSNYNMNPFQVMGTVRVGFKGLNFFANYNFTPLFANGEGPEVYPFSVGISFL